MLSSRENGKMDSNSSQSNMALDSKTTTSPRLLNLRIILTSSPRTSTSPPLRFRPSWLRTIGAMTRRAMVGSRDLSTSCSAALTRCDHLDSTPNGRTWTSGHKPLVWNVFRPLRNGLIDRVPRTKAHVHDVGPAHRHTVHSCRQYHLCAIRRRRCRWTGVLLSGRSKRRHYLFQTAQ